MDAVKREIPLWKEEYNTGIDDIDYQHKYFLGLINRLKTLQEREADHLHMTKYSGEIMLYTRFHFCSEENLMAYYEYPGLEEHALFHRNLITQINNRINLFEIEKLSLEELIDFLIQWFITHITQKDVEFAHYLKERGI